MSGDGQPGSGVPGLPQSGSARIPSAAGSRKSRIWWWVVVAFLIQFAVWAVWLKIAASAHVEDVPLATTEGQ